MILRIRFWRSKDPVAVRLARQFFDRPVMRSQFRTAYLKEMVSPFLQRHGWKQTDGSSRWDFEHADGCRLKLTQSAARNPAKDKNIPEVAPAFDIRPRVRDTIDNGNSTIAGRPADIYLVAWHPVFQLDEVDHRNPEQWQFFLLPTRALPQGQNTIGLARLRHITAQMGGGPVSFPALAGAVEGWRLRLRAETAIRANERTNRS